MHAALENLREDHHLIEPVLELLDYAADELLSDRDVDPGFLREMVATLSRFVDGFHYRKEHEALAPTLYASPQTAGAWLAETLSAEHARTTTYLARLREILRGVDTDCRGDRCQAAIALVAYDTAMREGLRTEDQAYFPLIEQLLDPEELNLLWLTFAEVDAEAARAERPAELYERAAVASRV